jgi:hypothetical protein
VTKTIARSLLLSFGLVLCLPSVAVAAANPPQNPGYKSSSKSMKAYQKQQSKQLKKTQKDQKKAQARLRKLHPEAR